MFCKNCGREIPSGSSCPYCNTAASEHQPRREGYRNEGNSGNYGPSSGGSNKGVLIFIIILLLIGIGVGAYFLFFNETPEERAKRKSEEIIEGVLEGDYSALYNQASDAADQAIGILGDYAKGVQDAYDSQSGQNSSGSVTVNPFEKISVTFSGQNGKGNYTIQEKDATYSTSYYTCNVTSGTLSNGDVITITFNSESFKTYHPECNFIDTTANYTVSGLTEAAGNISSNSSTYGTVPQYLRCQYSNDNFILPNSNSKYYTADLFSTMTDDQLAYARNEICAHAGRTYKAGSKYADYFSRFSWYNPSYDGSYFDDNIDYIINTYEKANLDLINMEEHFRKYGTYMLGD